MPVPSEDLQTNTAETVNLEDLDKQHKTRIEAADLVLYKIAIEQKRINEMTNHAKRAKAKEELIGKIMRYTAIAAHTEPERFNIILKGALAKNIASTQGEIKLELDLAAVESIHKTLSDTHDYTASPLPNPILKTSSQVLQLSSSAVLTIGAVREYTGYQALNAEEKEIVDWVVEQFQIEKENSRWFLKYGAGRRGQDTFVPETFTPENTSPEILEPVNETQSELDQKRELASLPLKLSPEKLVASYHPEMLAQLADTQLTQGEKADILESRLINNLEKKLQTLSETSQEYQQTKSSIKTHKLNMHKRSVERLTSTLHDTAQIVSLLDPKLGADLNKVNQSSLMIFDGLKTMKINEAMNLASMASVAGGLSLAMQLMQKNSGPSGDEIIADMLNVVLENQKKMLNMLSDVTKKIDRMQDDIDYLIYFSQKSLDTIRKDLTAVQREINAINQKVSVLEFKTQDLLAKAKIDELYSRNDIFRQNFENPNSELISMVNECQDNLDKCNQTLLAEYRKIWDHLSEINSFAINRSQSDNSIFTQQQIFLDRPAKEIEEILSTLSADKRSGLLPHISLWLQQQAIQAKISTNYARPAANVFEASVNPLLFTQVFIPLFVEAAQWYKPYQNLSNHGNQLRTEFKNIKNRTKEARDSLPLALAVHQRYAETMSASMSDQWNSNNAIKIIQTLIDRDSSFKKKTIELEKQSTENQIYNFDVYHQLIISNFNQDEIIEFGKKLNLWTLELKTEHSSVAKFFDYHDYRTKIHGNSGYIFLKLTNDGKSLDNNVSSKLNITNTVIENWKRDNFPNNWKLSEFDFDINSLTKSYRSKYVYIDGQKFEHLRDQTELIKHIYEDKKAKRVYFPPKGYEPPYERRKKLSNNTLNTLSILIARELDKQVNTLISNWNASLKNTTSSLYQLTDNYIRASYTLKTFMMVGYGNCDGASPEFNPLYHLHQSIPAVYSRGGLADNQTPEDYLHNLKLLPQSQNIATPDKMPLFPSPEAVHYCNYGYGDLLKAQELLQRLPL